MLTGLMVPLVMAGVWLFLRKLHKQLHTAGPSRH